MKRTLLITTLLIAAAVLLSNCTADGPCEGSLTLENPTPDTTVAVGDTIYIDLSGPPVFESTEYRITYSYNILSGNTYVDLAVLTGYKDDIKLDSLQIIGSKTGDSIVELL